MLQALESKRLLLKDISKEDREFILKEFSDDNINEYLYDADPFQTLAEADELIEFYNEPEPRNQHRWILVRKEDGTKIGTCGFHCWNRKTGKVEIGYDLQRAYWGQGYMSEATIRLAKRLGFQFNGEISV